MPKKKEIMVENDLLEQITILKSKGEQEMEILRVVLNLLLEESYRDTGASYKRSWRIGNRAFAIAYGSRNND